MSNAVFNSIRNQAANTISGSFKKVVGGIFNSKGASNTSAFAPLGKSGGSSTHPGADNIYGYRGA